MLCQVFCSQRPASQKHPPNFGNTSLNFGAPDEKQKNTLSLIPTAEKDPEKGRCLNMKKTPKLIPAHLQTFYVVFMGGRQKPLAKNIVWA